MGGRALANGVENELVCEAVEGSPDATAELLRRLRPLVRRYCYRHISPKERWRIDVDDVVQDVSIAVVHALPRYHYGIQAFVPYTYGIASRKIAEHRRMLARDIVLPVGDLTEEKWAVPDRAADPASSAERASVQHELRALLDTLAPATRKLIEMRLVDGLSAQETAEALGMSSSGAVRVAQHRAVSQLRSRLATCPRGGPAVRRGRQKGRLGR